MVLNIWYINCYICFTAKACNKCSHNFFWYEKSYLILTLHMSQYQKYICEEGDPSDICIEVPLRAGVPTAWAWGINWTPGVLGFFVTAAQLILIVCVIGLSISSHNAQNFRAVRRHIPMKLINYRQIKKNYQHLRIIFHTWFLPRIYILHQLPVILKRWSIEKVFLKNLLYDKCFPWECTLQLLFSTATLPFVFWSFLK